MDLAKGLEGGGRQMGCELRFGLGMDMPHFWDAMEIEKLIGV